MENLSLCEVCIHAPICGKLIAIGPLTECEHFYNTNGIRKSMDERTANIIWIAKGHHPYGDVTLKEAVAQYMSEECDCPIEVYTDRVLLSIVWEAFMDFMSVCTNPRYFLYSLKEAKYWCDYSPRDGVDDVQAILIAFQLCRVRDNEGYVNGFSDELIQYLEEKWDNG